MIREGDIGKKLFPDFPDMKVDFAEIGIGKIGKIGLAPPPPPKILAFQSIFSCIISSFKIKSFEVPLDRIQTS